MDTNYNVKGDALPAEIYYEGYIIRYYQEETSCYFIGFYVNSIWFPSIERAKAYIDRMQAKTSDDTSTSKEYGD
jgi:hypothetical protein